MVTRPLLTLADLKAMPPDTIFATGITEDPRPYNEPVRWLAVRGGIHDWAIYYHLPEKTIEWIRDHGDKCFTTPVIRELVPCDDEAFKMYRY